MNKEVPKPKGLLSPVTRDANQIASMILELEEMRLNTSPPRFYMTELRHAFNEALDRLRVLESKVAEHENAPR